MQPHYDLTAQGGGKTVAITPSASVPQTARFLFSGVPVRTGKLWNLISAICLRVTVVYNQHATTGTAIYWDRMFAIIQSIRVNCKLFGDLFVQQFITGPVAKHLVEFVGNGYAYRSIARQPIAAADGDTTVDLDVTLPIAQYWNPIPHHFNLWAGWFEGGYVDLVVGLTSALDAYSTGAITTPCTVRAWVEYTPSKELIIPPIPHWRLYQQAASGGTRMLLQGVGNDGGLQGTIDGARLLASFYHLDQLSFGGPDGADNIVRIALPWRDLEMTDNPDAFYRQYIGSCLRGHRGIAGGYAAATNHPDASGHPYVQGAEVPGQLNDAEAYVFPFVAPAHGDGKITKLQKVRGNYPIDFGFTTAPSTGTHYVTQCELKEFTLSKKAELIYAAGLNPEKVALKRKLMQKNTRSPDAEKMFCIPESVVPA